MQSKHVLEAAELELNHTAASLRLAIAPHLREAWPMSDNADYLIITCAKIRASDVQYRAYRR